MKTMGLDIGTKYIGVAVSDETGILASRITTLTREDIVRDIESIRQMITANRAGEVVVGLPINMDGTKSKQTKAVEDFVAELKKQVALPVSVFDERLTTASAERTLIDAGISRKGRKKIIDGLAAQYILQGYLDRKNV